MSKVKNLPEIITLADEDLLYAVDDSVGTNGGRKIRKDNLKASVAPTAAETKVAYESNPDTNAFTDAEKTKLAGIEAGATADQNASEVPYNNSTSGLSATEVQSAIDEVNGSAQGQLKPSIVSGRTLNYTSGTARFDEVFYELISNDIILNPSITNGEVYVDLDGLVKQTGSGILAPPYTIVIAKFSTDLNDIISLTDERVKNSQNIVRGILSDIEDVRAGASASQGSSGRLADADHKHNILTATVSSQSPDQSNAEGTSVSLARADHIHNIPTDAPTTNLSPSTSNSEGTGSNFARNDHTHAIETSLVGDITSIDAGDTASAGSVNKFARGDHQHAVSTATAVSLNADSTNTEGSSTSLSRADHTHDLVTGTPSSQTPDQANAEGTSANLARADHIHNIPAAAPITNLSPSSTNTEGSGSSFARNDHTHALSMAQAGDLSTVNAGDSESLGSVDRLIRADHQHPVSTAAASSLNADSTNTEGSSTSLARADHTHDLATGVPSSQTPDQSNAEGSSSNLARADHIHNIPAAAPTTNLSPATSNSEGTGSSFARNDHTHTIDTALVGDITTIQPNDSASAGTANTFARGDHRHAIAAAVVVNTGTANSEGSSTSFARADHVHNTVISNTAATATADDTTTSLTDVLIVGMTLTPAAGTYLATFSSSVLNSGNGSSRLFISIYAAGAQVTHSEREIGISGGANVPVHTNAVVTVNGSQTIEAQWRAVAGTNTAHERSLILIRLG